MVTPSTRVNQLDATLLDQELYNTLLAQSVSIFNKIAPIYKTKYNNEIELILRSLIFKYTVWDKSQSYGLFLQNLKFKNLTKLKKIAYYLVFILGYYGSKKLSTVIYNDDEDDTRFTGKRKKLWNFFKKGYMVGEKVYKVLSFANFIDFLITGKYQSLNLRLLNIKITIFSIELAKLNKGNISFEFQNRQLIWNTFLEFIIFTLPIFQNSKFQKIFQRLLYPSTDDSNANSKNGGKYAHLKQRQCPVCFDNEANKAGNYAITNPYRASCGHLYCYVCIMGKLEHAKDMDEKWKCQVCGIPVEYAKPLDDVDVNGVVFELDESEDDDSENESDQFDEKKENKVQRIVGDDDDDDESSDSYASEEHEEKRLEYDDDDDDSVYEEGEEFDEFEDDINEELDELDELM